jgi:hypothetical protein
MCESFEDPVSSRGVLFVIPHVQSQNVVFDRPFAVVPLGLEAKNFTV